MLKGGRFLEHGALALPLDNLAADIKKHYHTARPANDIRAMFAKKVEDLKKLCGITEASAIQALQLANKSHEVPGIDAAATSNMLGGPVRTDQKHTLTLTYGPMRKVVLSGSTLDDVGLDFARERQGAVVQRVDDGKPAAVSELVFEHDVVLQVRSPSQCCNTVHNLDFL